MSFILTSKTTFSFGTEQTDAMKHAVRILQRDFEKVFSARLHEEKQGDICFSQDGTIDCAERFELVVTAHKISVLYKDELAFIYAALYISRQYLKVDDFWFWAEKQPAKTNRIMIDEGEYRSPKARVRYRGWFVNDEVCLIGWSNVYPPSRDVWECVFETLLRLGGNMVIPGTDLPRTGQHFAIASEMGLYITHHHAEPLGSEMFLRAYPQEEASYDTNPELFEKLWAEAIERNKDKKIVWTLGFRGQGDAPFWHNDPKYTTPESRAQVIRRVIDKQYEMICAKVKDPVCAVYLYGEITELYEGGYLTLPKKFIKIWSDNGYGKMVVRRQGTHNPRTPALPHEEGKHGLYYHITFHDLQASSHLTMLSNPPELVDRELDAAFDAGADEYLLLNCGNIRPHVYLLRLVADKWNYGTLDLTAWKHKFAQTYFYDAPEQAIACYDAYFHSCVAYGPHEDDRAGDEFYFHTARKLITAWAKRQQTCTGMAWAVSGDIREQVKWIKQRSELAEEQFGMLVKQCGQTESKLHDKIFFRDNIVFQAKLHLYGARGLTQLCRAYLYFMEDEYPECFVALTDSMRGFYEAVLLLESGEHGKWNGFYSADWLTNVRVTVEQVIAIRKYVRLLGDAPDYFKWFKNYIMPETERQIYLENTQRRTLTDDELAEKLRAVLSKE